MDSELNSEMGELQQIILKPDFRMKKTFKNAKVQPDIKNGSLPQSSHHS